MAERATVPDGAGRAAKLDAVRDRMDREGVSAFLVPRADAHRGEWVAECDNRLSWLTGFSGSMGLCTVSADRAALFVDGRYTLQAQRQVDGAGSGYEINELNSAKVADWIRGAVKAGGQVGFDPWLHTKSEIEGLERKLADSGISLLRVGNLVDEIRQDRPEPPRSGIFGHPLSLSGETSASKRKRMAEKVRSAGAGAALLTLPDSIAWLLNIRGSDLPHSPVALAFAILDADGNVDLFLELPRRFEAEVEAELNIHPKAAFVKCLADAGNTVLIDPATAPVRVFDRLQELGRTIVESPDPCILAKAVKNRIEIANAEEAHRRDGAAISEFLAWLEPRAGDGLTELEVADAVNGFRTGTGVFRGSSFSTIAATGPNAAVVHYSVSPSSNRRIADGDLLLVDSGGQYPDGTTDITRTVAVGSPSKEAQTCFTLVLKGLIALARARWPEGRSGHHLDALARYHLWLEGLDFDHGTGHGVGQFLNVHEGPQSLAKRSSCKLLPGMILSIEPGYYREGEFGIRIENLAVVAEADPIPGGDGRSMLEFRNLTWAPIDRHLMVRELLAPVERQWIDDYHLNVLDNIGGICSEPTASWLRKACAPLR